MTKRRVFKEKPKEISIPKIGGVYNFLCETMNALVYTHNFNGTVAIVENSGDVCICTQGNETSIIWFKTEDIE